jgi:hypothetical protein
MGISVPPPREGVLRRLRKFVARALGALLSPREYRWPPDRKRSGGYGDTGGPASAPPPEAPSAEPQYETETLETIEEGEIGENEETRGDPVEDEVSYTGFGKAPPPLPPEAEAPPAAAGTGMRSLRPRRPTARYLNVLVFDEGKMEPHAGDAPLRTDSFYRLQLDIGTPAKGSIVRDPDEVPVEKLPERNGGHWLEVGIASGDFEVSHQISHLFLPTDGAAWVCDCERDGTHHCKPKERRHTLDFGVRTGSEPQPAHARISLYFENNVIQSLSLAADVVAGDDARGRGGIVAITDFTLSERLADVGQLEPRRAAIVVNETPSGTHVIVFKGSGEDLIRIKFSETQLEAAMEETRRNLLDIHIKAFDAGRRENRLKKDNRKGREELRADLTTMAEAGADYWTKLAEEGVEGLEAAGESDSKTIQVARVPSSVFVFPWAAVYDLPLGMREEGYDYCPLVEEWDGTGALVDPAVDACPHAEEHRGKENVICPFGFWGFRYAIEEPASTGNTAPPLCVNASEPPAMAFATSARLNATLTTSHLAKLGENFPGAKPKLADSRIRVGECLGEANLGIAYFYCHGRAATKTTKARIEVGKADPIEPRQIITWHRTAWKSVPDHWKKTRPLVFLNGCHTADLLPQTPVNFVDSFSLVGASGIVATEITLDQAMASEASEVFFKHLAGTPGMGVGEALRRTRAHFLGKGNMLGLAYTAYCRAELALMPPLPSL